MRENAQSREAAALNSAGAAHAARGEIEAALAGFERAIEADPGHLEAIVNAAIMLSRLGRDAEAADRLAADEAIGCDVPRYWSSRAAAERGAGRLADAARSYDACLQRDPTHAKARHGRARVALERGEDDMVARFDVAIALSPGDRELWLGKAHALDYAGDPDQARVIAETLTAQLPQWIAALELLAQLRSVDPETRDDFAAPFADAVARLPEDRSLYAAWARTLAGADRFAEAAGVAARARIAHPNDPYFALVEAVHAGEAGDDDRAQAIFATLTLDTTDRRLHEARHWLRCRDADRAEALLARVVAADPASVAGWALRDIAWRMMDDDRSEWLHGQNGLVRRLDLGIEPADLRDVIAALNALHDRAAVPIGQSVRAGTQTRGGLFDHHEAIFATLAEALTEAIEDYRDGLPPADPDHPLLRHRDEPWRIAGSWSIRLDRQGYHTAHIHPQGLLSSAAYLVVPDIVVPENVSGDDDDDPHAGWLELGRLPADLRLDLPPIVQIEPAPATLALFPSTLYHGTRRFAQGTRMSVAFDVAAAQR